MNTQPNNVPSPDPDLLNLDVLIIGAGFAGICMAIQLRRAGVESFLILERGSDVGGTWRVNTYPGCACDIPSHLYSFSFECNPHWTRMYPRQAEIRDYLRHCTDKYQLRPAIRFHSEAREAVFMKRRTSGACAPSAATRSLPGSLYPVWVD
jgi:cation diffusion facilitator CzcD-associated flavoprotein CzcO